MTQLEKELDVFYVSLISRALILIQQCEAEIKTLERERTRLRRNEN